MEFSNEFAEPYLRSQAGRRAGGRAGRRKPQKTHPRPLNFPVPAEIPFLGTVFLLPYLPFQIKVPIVNRVQKWPGMLTVCPLQL